MTFPSVSGFHTRKDMMYFITWCLTICLILGGSAFPFSTSSAFSSPQPSGLATVTTPDGFTIYSEIADTPGKRTIGLMYRTHMAPDHGMLFLFTDSKRWTFWMKNTKMALDILWLDKESKIVHVETHVPICQRTDNLCPRYRPKTPAVQVLELRAGQAAKLKLTPGVKLTIEMPTS